METLPPFRIILHWTVLGVTKLPPVGSAGGGGLLIDAVLQNWVCDGRLVRVHADKSILPREYLELVVVQLSNQETAVNRLASAVEAVAPAEDR